MPKYLSDSDASRMRAEGAAKHLPEASRKVEKAKDEHAETHQATVKLLGRLVAGQEILADGLTEQQKVTRELIKEVSAAGKRNLPAPVVNVATEKIKRWDFTIERDDDGRIKKVTARA